MRRLGFGAARPLVYDTAMIRGILTVGGWTTASRMLGFVRDILIADLLGAGPVADAFFVANRLPNLFRRLFGEGAFNAAFVPAFAGLLAAEGPAAATAFAEEAIAVMAFWLVGITIVAELFMPQLMAVVAPGFATIPAKFALAVELGADHVSLYAADLPRGAVLRHPERAGQVRRRRRLAGRLQRRSRSPS